MKTYDATIVINVAIRARNYDQAQERADALAGLVVLHDYKKPSWLESDLDINTEGIEEQVC